MRTLMLAAVACAAALFTPQARADEGVVPAAVEQWTANMVNICAELEVRGAFETPQGDRDRMQKPYTWCANGMEVRPGAYLTVSHLVTHPADMVDLDLRPLLNGAPTEHILPRGTLSATFRYSLVRKSGERLSMDKKTFTFGGLEGALSEDSLGDLKNRIRRAVVSQHPGTLDLAATDQTRDLALFTTDLTWPGMSYPRVSTRDVREREALYCLTSMRATLGLGELRLLRNPTEVVAGPNSVAIPTLDDLAARVLLVQPTDPIVPGMSGSPCFLSSGELAAIVIGRDKSNGKGLLISGQDIGAFLGVEPTPTPRRFAVSPVPRRRP